MDATFYNASGPVPTLTPIPEYHMPSIAGVRRRVAAMLIDGLLLAAFEWVLGFAFSSFWYSIGPYGRLVGLPILLAYFGIFNSAVGGGQTPGKRLVGIAVRDAANRPISIGRSLTRAAILCVPYTLNGWLIPEMQYPAAMLIAAVGVFGVGAAIVYTILFNRQPRQFLHDLACGTYVVYLRGALIERFPETRHNHRVVAGALIVAVPAVLGVMSLSIASLMGAGTLGLMQELQQKLMADGRYFSASVLDSTSFVGSQQVRILQVQVWYRGDRPTKEQADAIMTSVAKTALQSGINFSPYDGMRIVVTSAFDLGIASGYAGQTDTERISTWRQRIAQ